MAKKKIIRYKKPKNINIGMIVFAVIFLYLVITMIRYAVKPKIKMYEVQDGDIASDSYYTGVILRTEQVVNSEYSGYVSYYLQEKGKAAVGNLVFAVDENGAVNDYLNKTAGSESRLTEANLKELKTQLSAFSSSYSDQTFSRIYDLNNSMSSRLLEYLNINMLTELGATGEDLSLQKGYAKENGIVVYSTDGMEQLAADQITEDTFSKEHYQKTVYSTGQLLASGSPAYKLITADDWSVMIPLKDDEISRYTDVTSVSVRFTEKNLDASAAFSTFTGSDGKTYGRLDFSKYMIQFAEDRFVELEVKNSQASGLKLPKTALTEKEAYVIPKEYLTVGGDSADEGFYREVYANDGSSSLEFVEADILRITDEEEAKAKEEETTEAVPRYCYVSTDTLQDGDNLVLPDSNTRFQVGQKESIPGVYNINRGYAMFKYVKILDENSEYCVVKKNVSYSIRTYDHIVLKAELVSDSDILR